MGAGSESSLQSLGQSVLNVVINNMEWELEEAPSGGKRHLGGSSGAWSWDSHETCPSTPSLSPAMPPVHSRLELPVRVIGELQAAVVDLHEALEAKAEQTYVLAQLLEECEAQLDATRAQLSALRARKWLVRLCEPCGCRGCEGGRTLAAVGRRSPDFIQLHGLDIQASSLTAVPLFYGSPACLHSRSSPACLPVTAGQGSRGRKSTAATQAAGCRVRRC
jgi:hypothetical protein